MWEVFDSTPCILGEGPLWHAEIETLFWFDIENKKLYWRGTTGKGNKAFDSSVSAAGIVNDSSLLIAGSRSLSLYDINTGEIEQICLLEENNPVTRSNDGRADPYGGFWIGTMGFQAEIGAGSIYRYYRGELRKLYSGLSIPNAICFSPDGLYSFFVDTLDGKIYRQRLETRSGWPCDKPELFVDLSGQPYGSDGAVVDSEGNLWNAQWGRSQVVAYDRDAKEVHSISFPASQVSCPAFGGPELSQLFVTSAQQGMSTKALESESFAGQTFVVETSVYGQAEHTVLL